MRDRIKTPPLGDLAGGPLAGVSVVLVEPRNPINIGAVARTMANFGLGRLDLVAPRAFPHPEATRMAAGGLGLVSRARVFTGLPEALEGATLALAFTRREGKSRRPFLTPRDAAARILPVTASGGRAALVFGREDHGLSNAHLRMCPEVVVIPTDPACASLNLAQAVAVAAYELFLEAARPHLPEPLPAASLAQVNELMEHWARALLSVGFLDPKHPRRMIRYFERLFARSALTGRDIRVLRGLAHQMEWAASESRRAAYGIVHLPPPGAGHSV